MKRLWILLTTLSGALAASSALPAPSIEAGAAKAATCQACHGANGNSTNPEWPSLAGLGADYIADQLKNFKDGKRANPVMMPMTATMTADDMADLGMYFDSLANTGLEADPSFWQAGEKLYRAGDPARAIPACMACHGPTGKGNEPAKFPALRGQQCDLCDQAAERLRIGHALNRTERHHANHRQTPVSRGHAQSGLVPARHSLICIGAG